MKVIDVLKCVCYTGNRSGLSPGWNSGDGNRYLPACMLFDVSVSYATDKFNVGVNVYNITTKRYASNGWFYPEFGEWMFDVGAPTNFRIQTNIKL